MARLRLMLVLGPSLLLGLGGGLPERFHDLVTGDAAARLELANLLLVETPRDATLPKGERPAIEDVRAALASEDPLDRILGAAATARLGADAKELLPEITALLAVDSDPLLYWLVEAIRRIGPDAESAAPELVRLLHHHGEWSFSPAEDWTPDRDWRDAAHGTLAALAALGPAGLRAVQSSLPGRPYVRPGVQTSVRILERLLHPGAAPPPAPAPREDPPSPLDDLRRQKAAELPALLKDANSDDEGKSGEALAILEWLGPLAKDAGAELFELLSSEDDQVRAGAAAALGACGAADPAWVDDLVPHLDEPGMREGVAKTLGAIGPAAAPARAKLVEILLAPEERDERWGPRPYDGSVLSRAAAAEALGRIGGPPEALVPPLLEAGGTGAVWSPPPMGMLPYQGPPWYRPGGPYVDLREVAADAIGALGIGALPEVRKALSKSEPPVRAAAAAALSRFPPEGVGDAAPRAARDPDPGVRIAVLPALARAADEPALRALAALLEDEDAKVREAARETIGSVGPAAEAVAPAVVARLKQADRNEAYELVEVLWKISAAAEELLVPAAEVALDRHPELLGPVGWRLRKLGEPAKAAIPAVAAVAERSPSRQRRSALGTLRELDPAHPATVAAFRALATDEDARVREQAIWLLAVAGANDAKTLRVLTRALDDGEIRGTAARALATLAPESPEALAILARRVRTGAPVVRGYAAAALAAAGHGNEAVNTALSLLDSDEKAIRRQAVETIAAIGGVAAAFEPLRTAFEAEKDFGTRLALYRAIASTGADGTAYVFELYRKAPRDRRHLVRDAIPAGGVHAVPRLREWVRSRNLGTYYAGAVMLGEIGEPAHVAIPDLVALADSGRSQALGAAIQGLSLMGAPPDVLFPLLRRALAGGNDARFQAGQALSRIGAVIGPIVPDVARAVPAVRFLTIQACIDALEGVGEEAVPALPYLIAALPGSRSWERELLTRCLGNLAAFSDAPRARLLASLTDPVPRVRIAAIEALAERFSGDADVVAALGKILVDPDATARRRAAERLEAMGPAALPAVPALATAAETAERDVCRPAIAALAGVPAAADLVRPRLLALAKGTDPWRAHDALAALGRIDGDPDELLAALRAGLAAWDWRLRAGATRGLAALAPRHEGAARILDELMADPSLPVRVAARGVLDR